MESRRNHFSVSLPIVNTKVWWLIVCWSQVACQLSSMLVSFYSFSSFSCLWLCRVFTAARGFLCLGGQGDCVEALRPLLWRLFLWRSSGFGREGLVEGAWAHLLWGKGQARVPCLGSGVPPLCASRGVFSGLGSPGLESELLCLPADLPCCSHGVIWKISFWCLWQ